jgi:hypothetical protein
MWRYSANIEFIYLSLEVYALANICAIQFSQEYAATIDSDGRLSRLMPKCKRL